MRENLEFLEKLQEVHLKIEKLEEKREEIIKKSPLPTFKKELVSLKSKLDALREKEAKASREHKKAMGELELLEQKIEREKRRLYSGTVTNPKELKTINDEIASLEKLKERLEDKFLEVALLVEELERTISLTEKGIKEKGKEVEEEESNLKEVEKKTRTEVEKLQREAGELREKIPTELLRIYDSRREKLAKKVVSRLNNGICSGCNMELHAEELDKIVNNPEKLAYCPNCQRILLFREK